VDSWTSGGQARTNRRIHGQVIDKTWAERLIHGQVMDKAKADRRILGVLVDKLG
jgi:hypothetical protein